MITSRSDMITPKVNFSKNFTISIPQREFYNSLSSKFKNLPTHWYTDGSKTSEGTGSGIYGPNTRISIGLDKFASVFQTEVLAISRCAELLHNRNPKGQSYVIHSDSQAAIQALDSYSTNSSTVLECRKHLNRLGLRNTVQIFWIPGHSGMEGNEEADRLANVGSASRVFGPSPSLPIGWF